jgi:hypothetical protein
MSSADSAWIQDALSDVRTDRLVAIREIRVVGLDPKQTEFVKSLLPVHVGQSLLESRLQDLIDRHNAEMAGRRDLWENYVAGIAGFGPDSTRIVVVEAIPFTAGTYYGGGAYAYIGDYDVGGVGAHRGYWIGYNRDGMEWDSNFGGGWYLGGEGVFSFPLPSVVRERQETKDLSIAARVRKTLNPSLESRVRVGTSLTMLRDPEGDWNLRKDLSVFVGPALEYTPAAFRRDEGHLFDAVLEGVVGWGTISKTGFGIGHGSMLFRAPMVGPFSVAATARSEDYFVHPAVRGEMTTAFSANAILDRDPDWMDAWTVEFQERCDLLKRQIGFTRMDGGLELFEEGLVVRDRTLDAGWTAGLGAFLAFTAPVGVDFNLQAGFCPSGWQGIRLETLRYY